MRRLMLACLPAAIAGCMGGLERGTLAELHTVEPDLEEIEVQDSLDLAMESYRRFLNETPTGRMTPEAMRRLADLQIEKEFGITGDGERWIEMAAPEPGAMPQGLGAAGPREAAVAAAAPAESDEEFEARTTRQHELGFMRTSAGAPADDGLPAAAGLEGPLEAIALYERLLTEYPNYERADQVLYQMARAYDELGRTDEAMEVSERLIREYGYSKYFDEVQFRRGEYFFTRRMYLDAESAYQAITERAAHSEFYELALYKLGWTLYKQELYEEALHQYMALLDHKLSIGYDFDAEHAEEDERRVADTFRVISLSFSNLGGPEVLQEYYDAYGNRSYEDRIYANLGEFYFDKLRYNDAAKVYESFVDLYPFHEVSPLFGMRIIEVYEAGGFPQLVVEAKKDFSTKYGLQAEYWQHFDAAERPEVLAYLKTNLKDLANHYHALYQDEGLGEEKPANYAEARTWYRAFLASFPQDVESPGIHYQLADLLLENEDFLDAAREYERTAYDYPPHERASAAGYAAIFAHREHLKRVSPDEEVVAKQATVESSLRFADAFPEHEHAPAVLGAATEDLYSMSAYAAAAAAGRTLVERYPAAEAPLRISAWSVIGHSSLELADYPAAEHAYAEVLALVPPDDESRPALIDNLAASIYKQGELANEAGDYRAAAEHFLRIKDSAPTSQIRPAAEYDAAAALMRIEDWKAAAAVLDAFRAAFPEHELGAEATKQLAYVYREDGELSLAAEEYERVAAEAADAELRRDALLAAGDLHEQVGGMDRALAVYEEYVAEFDEPVEIAVETRFKIAGMYEARGDLVRYREALEAVVAADAAAGGARTDRTRFLAAKSALALAEPLYGTFAAVELVQPFDASLARKRELMDAALDTFERLVEYEVGEVTAAATFYIAEVYSEFSRSLLESERPTDLDASALVEYEEVLEEEAFPFEELAIEVHEKNVELAVAGVYNAWIEKSYGRLAALMPGRYAKPEESAGFVGAIDVFRYRSPAAEEAAAIAAAAAAANPQDERGRRKGRGSDPADADAGLFTLVERTRFGADVRSQYDGALIYLEQGRLEPGIGALTRVTEQAPSLVHPHVDLGVAYARAGDLERAAASLEAALALNADHPVALNELGLVRRRQGRFAEARTSYERALAVLPDFHFAAKNLAIVCDLYLRDLGCALSSYEAYAALVPDDEDAAIWIADLRSRLGQ